MSRRLAPLAAVLAAVALGATGCGGGDSQAVRAEKVKQRAFEPPGPGSLAWEGTPIIVRNRTLPNDRILAGTIVDKGLAPVKIRANRVHVQSDRGVRLQAAATFLRAFSHRLYPPDRPPPGGLTEYELERTGFLARIAPGGRTPVTVSWRLRKGAPAPTEIVFDGAVLPIPGS